ncbi:MAG: DUF2993 domain-containing protein, partial [Actinomycetota bacterium]|nr:DUF2993 domain-containing protein [Actinomycetota bacterium]
MLPVLIEARLATNLQERYGLEEKPEVEVSSGFPLELLLGRIDHIEVHIDHLRREGILLREVRIVLEEVNLSVLSLLQEDLEREIQAASLVAEVPEESINDYLRENDLGLEGGEIDVRPQGVVYRSSDAFFGLSASVELDLRVAGPYTVEVIPQEATVGGFPLPSFLEEPLASGGRTLTLSELPLNTELMSVEPERNTLVVQAGR